VNRTELSMLIIGIPLNHAVKAGGMQKLLPVLTSALMFLETEYVRRRFWSSGFNERTDFSELFHPFLAECVPFRDSLQGLGMTYLFSLEALALVHMRIRCVLRRRLESVFLDP